MALEAAELDLIRDTVINAVESAQERLAQMVAKQFVEIRADIQDMQEALRKLGNRQVQVEADLVDVVRVSEDLKRRLRDIHDDLTDREPDPRDRSLRLDILEREVAEIRHRLSSIA